MLFHSITHVKDKKPRFRTTISLLSGPPQEAKRPPMAKVRSLTRVPAGLPRRVALRRVLVRATLAEQLRLSGLWRRSHGGAEKPRLQGY
jgi:hypothetical protein